MCHLNLFPISVSFLYPCVNKKILEDRQRIIFVLQFIILSYFSFHLKYFFLRTRKSPTMVLYTCILSQVKLFARTDRRQKTRGENLHILTVVYFPSKKSFLYAHLNDDLCISHIVIISAYQIFFTRKKEEGEEGRKESEKIFPLLLRLLFISNFNSSWLIVLLTVFLKV